MLRCTKTFENYPIDSLFQYILSNNVNLGDVTCNVVLQCRQRDWKPLCPLSKGNRLEIGLYSCRSVSIMVQRILRSRIIRPTSPTPTAEKAKITRYS